jgi:hypothetical protein
MKRFVEAFAQSGDKTDVPNTTQSDGSVSYAAGYGPDYEKNLDSDPEAKRIERQKMNKLFNDVTASIKLWQEQGYPMFVSAADNGGVAMPYKKGMKVVFTDGNIYQSLIDNNDGVPATDFSKWSQVSGVDGEYVTGGTYKKGEIVTATDGNQYWCNKPNDGSSPVNPVGDSSDSWRQYPYKEISGSNSQGDSYFGTVDFNSNSTITIKFTINTSDTEKDISFPGSFSGDRTISYSLDDEGRKYGLSHSFFNPSMVTINLRKFQDASSTPTDVDGMVIVSGKLTI